ncbi:high light inducible protein [Acaryochloris sp. 'Moss Beach']|nr:high light inducible protein [Acaryochloris sp. 'Moss Beach']UJB68668.1 high light inducible protein [Acaryochloris sp. 'Moss Beach']
MNTQPSSGFSVFSETWNGRLAMIGLTLAIITEALTGQGILGQLIAWFSF